MSFIINPYWYAQTCSDADANAFLTATGITNPAISSAVCTLVTSLKSANLWTKFNAIYPMVGGTATTHMYNLRNPANTNAAFRLSFSGGWTHSANGALPGGVNSFADTFLIPNNILNLNSTHFSVYLNTNAVSGADMVDLGVQDALSTNRIYVEPASYSGNVYYINNANGANFITTTDQNSLGFYINNRISSSVVNGFKNSIKIINNTTRNSSALSIRSIYLSAFNSVGTPLFFSTRRNAFASIGSSLTDSEASTLYTIIQTFQTTLGRQV